MPTGLLVPYLLFHVELVGTQPPIWRSFLLPEPSTFNWLHRAILAAAAWKDGHRFTFQETDGAGISVGERGSTRAPDGTAKLANYFASVGQACIYQYSPEERWQFEVRLIEKRGQSRHDRFLRRLVGGARAYPTTTPRALSTGVCDIVTKARPATNAPASRESG
jgi:hypothetical protein